MFGDTFKVVRFGGGRDRRWQIDYRVDWKSGDTVFLLTGCVIIRGFQILFIRWGWFMWFLSFGVYCWGERRVWEYFFVFLVGNLVWSFFFFSLGVRIFFSYRRQIGVGFGSRVVGRFLVFLGRIVNRGGWIFCLGSRFLVQSSKYQGVMFVCQIINGVFRSDSKVQFRLVFSYRNYFYGLIVFFGDEMKLVCIVYVICYIDTYFCFRRLDVGYWVGSWVIWV